MNHLSRSKLLHVYAAWFAPDTSNYAAMQPRGRRSKYIRANQPLTQDVLADALDGKQTVAAVPIAPDGTARAAILDVDQGGRQAVADALDICTALGVWAFAQLGENADGHSGGHVIIPSAAPLPAPLLLALAQSIQARAGVVGECWPTQQDLRLPLQVHLRAPGGPRRFPVLLPSGELIEGDGWAMLAALRDAWTPNPPELLTRLAGELAPPSPERPARLHKSHVNALSGETVISWYVSNYELADILKTAGADIADRRAGVTRCPFHDDKSPSLGYWTIAGRGGSERRVCKCLSRHSNCPLAARPWLDAFDVFCHLEGLTPSEAVKTLVERHGLGKRQTFKASPAPVVEASEPPRTLDEHAALIASKRDELAHILQTAAARRGVVTDIKGVPGIGKTEQAAALVEVLHPAGRRVAIIAPSKEHAAAEWTPRLSDPFIWRARKDICTCYPPSVIDQLERKGYFVECTSEDCPYKRQRKDRAGHVAIFQYPHLVLNGGELLTGYDLVIIDESPLASLLSEQTATLGEVNALIRRMDPNDPGRPLARALSEIADAHNGPDLYGPKLLTALVERVSDVAQAIKAAQTSPAATLHPVAPKDVDDPARLPRQFWGKLLQALAHDATGQGNSLLVWGKSGEAYAWSWFAPAPMLEKLSGRLPGHQPAVIVLDGTADPVVSERLYAPWPVHFEELSAPLSPAVRLVQASRGPSTRRAFEDGKRIDHVARSLAVIGNELDLPAFDGLISYKSAAPLLAEKLGIEPGRALHYGGQRGSNTLANARTVAVVASPTVPPNVVERRARALWRNDAPIVKGKDAHGKDTYWTRRGTGDYEGVDLRLEALARVHGPAELVQAIHRARPLLASEPSTVVVLTPWNLDALGLPPNMTIDELPHGNSERARVALDAYRTRVISPEMPEAGAFLDVTNASRPPTSELQSGIRKGADFYPQIVIDQLPANWQEGASCPPLPAKAGEVIRAPAPPPSADDLEWAALIIEAAQQQGVRVYVQGDRVTLNRRHSGIEQAIVDAGPGLALALRYHRTAATPAAA